jgi:hypothetical protein
MNDDIPRDSRSEAPEIAMDLTRDDASIHRDLRSRWPRMAGMWWELEPGEESGWVYSGSNKILAKLTHVVDDTPGQPRRTRRRQP